MQIFQKTLNELGLEAKVYTTDMKPEMAPAGIVSDGCVKVSRCTADCYIEELLQICKDKDIGVIIPTIDTELLILSQNKQHFDENGVGLAVSDYDFIKVCRDKRNTEDYLAKLGIAVPRALDKYHPVFPMFAKPYDGSLSTNLHVIRKQEELTKDILEDPKLIFMEYIDKQEYKEFTVDMYYGKDGKVPRMRGGF